LLLTTLKILQLLGTLSPRPPTGASPLDPAGGLPSPDLWFPPHSIPPSAAFGLRTSNLVYGWSTMSRITPTCEMTSNLEALGGCSSHHLQVRGILRRSRCRRATSNSCCKVAGSVRSPCIYAPLHVIS